jgi:formylglycine-generating enzyme required for sulfatase activity
MTEPISSFVSATWLKPLYKQLTQIWGRRDAELQAIADTFGDPRPLARYYVEPKVQHHNPADKDEDERAISYVRAPAFEAINAFLTGDTPLRGGHQHLFILSDAGMGKTSLLLMIRLSHLFSFWPKRYRCELLKLGPDTLERIAGMEHKADTVLLLDALDEDPTAWGRIEERLLELIRASDACRRVILSCRTQFFPAGGADPFGRPGRVEIGGWTCPMLFLSLFDDAQVDAYLRKRFPDKLHQRLLARENPIRQRAVALVKPMRSLRFRPLLLSHIESIVSAKDDVLSVQQATPDADWNAYRLYEALVQTWLLREERKLSRQFRAQSIQPPDAAALLDLCALIAVHLQVVGRRELPLADLAMLRERHSAARHLSDLDVGGRSLLNRNAEGEYRFSHYSIQEFLVVRAIVTGALDFERGLLRLAATGADGERRTVRMMEVEQRLRATDQMLEFFAGAGVLPGPRVDLSTIQWKNYRGLTFQDRLANGALGPELQLILPGRFLMGSPDDDPDAGSDEKPQHEVEIADAFAIGRYPVTFDEYDVFCAATGRDRADAESWGRGRRPVINVSWEDAEAYCNWLSEQTGARYLLPTEAQWECAARAGSTTRWCFGDKEIALTAYAWYDQNARSKTHPVGSKESNAWGVHDCHGNVWEWVRDTWHVSYHGAPADGSAREPSVAAPGADRVVRGGSWRYPARFCRSAVRLSWPPDSRYSDLGFRCARVQA